MSVDKEKFRIVIKSAQERFGKLNVECAIVETPDFSLTENIYKVKLRLSIKGMVHTVRGP